LNDVWQLKLLAESCSLKRSLSKAWGLVSHAVSAS
jgi:hypothetical protein